MKIKKKTKKLFLVVGIITLISILSVGAYFLLSNGGAKNMVEVGGLYDANGNLIRNGFSVVGGVEGVKYISLNVNVKNEDTVPLILKFKSISPLPINFTIPSTKLSLNSQASGSWKTGLIDIEPYEGTVQEFCVTILSEKIPSLRESSEMSGCVSIKVDPNPVGTFGLTLDSNIGTESINPSCTESWVCSDWTACSNSIQTRTCTDSNECGTSNSKPSETNACVTTFSTNAINGKYKVSGVWINFGHGQYTYNGYSSYDCLAENLVMNTPEGYSICTRPGYEVTERVYLDDGQYGILFKP